MTQQENILPDHDSSPHKATVCRIFSCIPGIRPRESRTLRR